MEDDPNIWEALMRILKMLHESMSSFFMYALPAFVGAVIGVLRKDRRKGARKRFLVLSIIMSWMVGCGITPLFAHVFGIPENAAGSLAFFLGVYGVRGLDVLCDMFRKGADIGGSDNG
jgi:energy-converting hydrogenase Eha subunit A